MQFFIKASNYIIRTIQEYMKRMSIQQYGNRLALSLLLVGAMGSASAQTLQPGSEQVLLKAKQGSIVELPGFFSGKFQEIAYKKMVLPGPQYIISDDPEYIRVPEAVALREAVQPGAVRVYMYNVNGVKDPKMDRRINTVIKNTGDQKMTLRMLKYSSQKPTTNYFGAGKNGLADYFNAKPEARTRSIKPGQTVVLDEAMEKRIAKYDELAHGFYEFVIDQPGVISVVQTSPEKGTVKASEQIDTVLSSRHSNAGRGIFGVSNYQVNTTDVFDTKNGPAVITIADGSQDPWVQGKDAATGKIATLAGNYGVIYHIEMKWKSTDGKGLALVTWNARSADNKWCGGMANTMVVSEGKFKAGVIKLPEDRLTTKAAPEAVLVQIFPPAKDGEEQIIRMTYSPPGASCLPTPLVFIPVDMNK